MTYQKLLHIVSALIIFTACEDYNHLETTYTPNQRGHYLHLSQYNFSIGAEEQSKALQVSAINSWQFKGMDTWFNLSPTNGSGNTDVLFSATENKSGDVIRTSIFTFESADPDYHFSRNVSITQQAAVPFLNVSETSLVFSASAFTSSITVDANIEWDLNVDSSWLNVTLSPDKRTLTISANENTTIDTRTAHVMLTGKDSKTITVVQSPPSSLVVNKNAIEFNEKGGNETLTIVSDVAWKAVTSEPWLQLLPENGNAGKTTLEISAAPNSTADVRSGFVRFLIENREMFSISVKQTGRYLKVSHTSLIFSAENDYKNIQIDCNAQWSILSKPEWIETSATSGFGNAEITLSVEEYWGTTEKTGTMRIGLDGTGVVVPITLSQRGRYFPDLISSLSFDAISASKNVTITTDGKWTATASANWITVSPSSGTGNSEIQVSVSENTSLNERSGIVSVSVGEETKTIAVTQKGKYFDDLPSLLTFEAKASSQKVKISTDGKWTAKNDNDWITISTQEGTGETEILVSVTENLNEDERSGEISVTVSGVTKTITVKQTGPKAPSTSHNQLEFNWKGGTYELTVTSEVAWKATTSDTWLQVSPENGDAGSSTLNVTVPPYISTNKRDGAISILIGEREVLTLNVTQYGMQLDVNPHSITFGANAESQVMKITSDSSWIIQELPDWVTASEISGLNDTELTLSVDDYWGTEDKDGVISVELSEIELVRQVTLKQEGRKFTNLTPTLSFEAGASSQMATITTDGKWIAISSNDWISIDKSSGTGDAEIEVSVTENLSLDERTGSIVVTVGDIAKTITVSQNGKYFSDLIASLSFNSDASTQTITVHTDGEWTASCSSEWITTDPTSGKGETDIEVSVTENTSNEERSGIISIVVAGLEKTISVRQEGKYFVVNSTSTPLPSTGGKHIIHISTNDTWTVTTEDDWISPSATSGKGDIDVTLTIADNPSIHERQGTTIFSPANLQPIKVVTSQAARYLTINKTSVIFHSQGGTSASIAIDTDATFEITTSDNWIVIHQNGNTFTITTTENQTGNKRTGIVTIAITGLREGESFTKEVTVTQSGKTIDVDPYGNDESWDSKAQIIITTSDAKIKWD